MFVVRICSSDGAATRTSPCRRASTARTAPCPPRLAACAAWGTCVDPQCTTTRSRTTAGMEGRGQDPRRDGVVCCYWFNGGTGEEGRGETSVSIGRSAGGGGRGRGEAKRPRSRRVRACVSRDVAALRTGRVAEACSLRRAFSRFHARSTHLLNNFYQGLQWGKLYMLIL
jgi:hypothetical protein